MSVDQALVLAGHGSHHDSGSAAPIYEHADRIRRRGCFDAVRPAFWKEQPSLAEVRSTLEAATNYVVPLLTSEGYFAGRVFPRELALNEDASDDESAVTYTEPVGTHERLGEVITDWANAITGDDVNNADIGLALVGHGTERHERSADATVAHATRLRETNRFASVQAAFLDQEPNVADITRRVEDSGLVVVPLFMSNGHHVTRDIPDAIGLTADDGPFGGPTRVNGTRLWYTRAIGTAPTLTAMILDRAAEVGADVRPGLVDPLTITSKAEAAFLRWLEPDRGRESDPRHRPSEQTRGWGELVITVNRTVDHDRFYSIRHGSDREAPRAELDALPSPTAVRERTGLDEGGNHRPLRTARSLPAGWRYETADPGEITRTIRTVYPASIDHWYHARAGTLEVTDFGSVIDRQAGRYRDLDAIEPAALSATIDACCGDCVRRRAWSAGADEPNPDDESLPCTEPCSFLLEAARSLPEIQVSDPTEEANPSVPAAAFDQPANRYRVRYQRALKARGPDTTEPTTSP